MQSPQPSLEWQITKRCNYRCSYCCQKQVVSSKGKHCSRETIDAVFKLLTELPGTWLVKLIGGEPLIHPEFFDICRHVSQTRHRLCMTTNFSLPLQKLEQLIDITDDTLVFLTASLHLEQVASVEQFIEKAAAFNSKKHPTTDFCVTSVCLEEKFDVLKKVARRFEIEGVRFKFQWLKSGGRYVESSDDFDVEYPGQIEQSISDKLGENVTHIKEANLFGTLCHSGELFFRIGVDGGVMRCYNAQPLYYLGNITKGTFRPLKGAKPCMAARCSCTLPANRGMILFGQRAGKYALAKAYCESWTRRLPRALARMRQ